MPCGSASSSSSCGVAYPTFSGCGSLNFSCVFLCIPVHICILLHVFFLIVLWLLQGTSFYGCFRHDKNVGSCWTVFSCLSMDTLASWLDASTACPMLILERYYVVALSPLFPKSSGFPTTTLLVAADCRCVCWFGSGCFRHLPPT